MPLYLVRGPDWGVLVRARNANHAAYIVDEEGDPGACEIREYHGPVAIELSVPCSSSFDGDFGDPNARARVDFDEVPESIDLMTLPRLGWFADTGKDMQEVLLGLLWPRVGELVDAVADRALSMEELDRPLTTSEARVTAAFVEDFQLSRRGAWRRAQLERRDDSEASVMSQLGITIEASDLLAGARDHQRWLDSGWGPIEPNVRSAVAAIRAAADRNDSEALERALTDLERQLDGIGDE